VVLRNAPRVGSHQPTRRESIGTMSRFDTIRRELEIYLAELDAERNRVQTFLDGTGSILDDSASERLPATTPTPRSVSHVDDARPVVGGDALALRVMAERSDVPHWTAPTLLPVLQGAGWQTAATELPNAVGAILSRLKRNGKLELVSRGIYRLPRPTNAESPKVATSGLSVLDPATQEGGGASGTDTHRVRDDPSSWPAEHLDHDLGAPVGTGA